jgi:fatty acid desaturase
MARWPDDVKPEFDGEMRGRPGDPRVLTQEDVVRAARRAALARAVTSIVLMLVGGIIVSVASGILWTWPAGLLVCGALIFATGIITGFQN